MTSAAPQKRMVSSVFITLSSPHRATVTQQQQQHACKTRHAPARGAQHAAVRIHPGGDGGGMLSPGHRKGSTSSESQGGTAQNGSWQIPARPRTPSDTPPPAPAAGLPDPVLDPNPPSRLGRQDPRRPTLDQPPEELFPPPPPPPMPVDAELSGPAAALPLPPSPPEQPPPSAPLTPAPPAPPPPSNKQDTIVETKKITPSSGRDVQSSPVHTNIESREVCGFCRKPVALSEPAIEALNRTYHDGCFQCRQCHIPLAGKLYYNKAGIPLCEDCYQASLELCWACGEVIRDHVIRALERTYHPPCFICATCSQPIGEQRFAQGEVGEVYCLQDYYGKYAPRCSACQQLIIPREDGTDSYTVECLGRSFHEDCYRCEVCLAQLSPEPNDQGCHPLDGRVLCKVCHLTLVQSAQL